MEPVALRLGIFSLYLALLLGPTYYLRNRLGARAWKIVHQLSVAVYILAVVHTLYFDFHGPHRLALWVAQIPLAAMVLWRLTPPVSPAGRRKKAQLASNAPAAGSMAANIHRGKVVAVICRYAAATAQDAEAIAHRAAGSAPTGTGGPFPSAAVVPVCP